MTEEEIRPIAEQYVEEYCHCSDGEYTDGSLICAGIGTALIVARRLEKKNAELREQIEKMKDNAVEIITKALNVNLDRLFNNIDDWEKPSECIVNFDCHSLAEAQRVKSIWDKFCTLCNRKNEKREVYKFKNMNGTFTYRFCLLRDLKDCKLNNEGCYVDKE